MPNLSPTVQPGQRSQDIQSYLFRLIPEYSQPDWYDAERWRRVVRNLPVATVCRDTLISYLNSLDWSISPRDSSKRDELKDEIKYYEKLFEDFSGLDFSSHIEWLCTDMLDLPFGGASEIGREGDKPDGRVMWIQNLDGGTLYPTQNLDNPVIQRIPGSIFNPVAFPKHAIDRIYMSPRTDIYREGWGMPPPEKIYLALEMLWRGDKYYVSMLLDTPEAGILDLGDMSKTSAEEWVQSFRTMVAGVDPFKVPVLYEHTSEVKFIPFQQPPANIIFDSMMQKYKALICAGYGLTLGDIGEGGGGSGGETLAGTIRGERKTRRAGYATIKRKTTSYFNKILPDSLQFKWIDLDDEVVQNLGRARLSSASAFTNLVNLKAFTPLEVRQQMIADGLLNVPMPEKPDESEFDNTVSTPNPRNPDTGDQISNNAVNPSQGGWGSIKSIISADEVLKAYDGDESEETKAMKEALGLATNELIKHEKEYNEVLDALLKAKEVPCDTKEEDKPKKKPRKKKELHTELT